MIGRSGSQIGKILRITLFSSSFIFELRNWPHYVTVLANYKKGSLHKRKSIPQQKGKFLDDPHNIHISTIAFVLVTLHNSCY